MKVVALLTQQEYVKLVTIAQKEANHHELLSALLEITVLLPRTPQFLVWEDIKI